MKCRRRNERTVLYGLTSVKLRGLEIYQLSSIKGIYTCMCAYVYVCVWNLSPAYPIVKGHLRCSLVSVKTTAIQESSMLMLCHCDLYQSASVTNECNALRC
jgi:hypothetical protein